MRLCCLGLRWLGRVALVCALGSLAVAVPVRASGPVERMVQLLAHPTDPSVLVVRFGLASEGYLFSRDGGRTFRATCSQAIAPTLESNDKLTKLSGVSLPSAGATLLDTRGRVLLGHGSGFWVDDGMGCGWSKDAGLAANQWAYSIQRDPKQPDEILALVTTTLGEGDNLRARADLMRRDASGRWIMVGALKQPAAGELVYAGELLATSVGAGTRLYASYSSTVGSLQMASTKWFVAVSDDGGRVWRQMGQLPSALEDNVSLLAVDPGNSQRVLASNHKDSGRDQLLLSDDQGKTFRPYAEVAETSGLAFAPDGRVFVADAGDQDAEGGVWTAAKLGDPLVKIKNTSFVDCIGYDAASAKLRVCRRHRFGQMDPTSGAFEELSRLDTVASLVTCPNLDVVAECQTQFNAGPSWCCTGHFTSTPFCGSYDVTRVGKANVYCGISGRKYDEMIAGSGRDGGADIAPPSVSSPTASSARRADGGGCTVGPARSSAGSAGGVLASLGLLLVVLGRSLRRRSR